MPKWFERFSDRYPDERTAAKTTIHVDDFGATGLTGAGIGVHGIPNAEIDVDHHSTISGNGTGIEAPAGTKIKVNNDSHIDKNDTGVRIAAGSPAPVVGTITGGNVIVAPNANAPVTQNNFGPPREGDGFYQADKKLGKGQITKQSGAKIVFSGYFSEPPDPSLPIEYGSMKLRCDHLPQPESSAPGPWQASVMGLSCDILK